MSGRWGHTVTLDVRLRNPGRWAPLHVPQVDHRLSCPSSSIKPVSGRARKRLLLQPCTASGGPTTQWGQRTCWTAQGVQGPAQVWGCLWIPHPLRGLKNWLQKSGAISLGCSWFLDLQGSTSAESAGPTGQVLIRGNPQMLGFTTAFPDPASRVSMLQGPEGTRGIWAKGQALISPGQAGPCTAPV